MPELVTEYAAAVSGFVARPDEEARERAYELGRMAIQQGLGVLDVSRIHALALEQDELASLPGLVSWQFFSEVLAPYEMALRGVRDANATLKRFAQVLEERVNERTSELRATERRLREQGDVLRSVLDSMTDGVLVIDTDDRVALINRAAEALFTLRPGEPAHAHAADTPIFASDEKTPIPPEERPHARALRGEVVRDMELFVSRGPGREGKHLRISASPLRDEDDHLRGVVMVCEDATARRKAEEAARRAEERLQRAQKLDAIGQLAGGVAHDFNNLLAVILSYGNLLSDALPPESPEAADAREIQRAATSAASLTRQLLAFSRQQVLQLGALPLNDVVEETSRMLERALGEHVELRTALAPTLPPVLADRGQMEQVLMNLAVNARDAMPGGGKLTIETARTGIVDGEEVGRPSLVPGDYVVLSVSDTGVGMDAETMGRIFEPFFTTKERGRGTGLGLATVYGIVQQSGGNITCYSEVGRGTTFRVYLPVANEPAPAVTPPARSASRGNETVLLVEDEERLRVVGTLVLTAHGYTVLPTTRPEEAHAVSRAHGGPIHLLLTDVVMPGGSGPALAEELARERPEMRVLYVSGYASAGAFGHGHVPRDAAFLEKPFTANSLRERVRQVLDQTQERS